MLFLKGKTCLMLSSQINTWVTYFYLVSNQTFETQKSVKGFEVMEPYVGKYSFSLMKSTFSISMAIGTLL